MDQFKLLATTEKSEADRVRAVQSEEGHLRAQVTFEDPELNLYAYYALISRLFFKFNRRFLLCSPQFIRQALILKMGFERPSKVQAATLPLIMQQKNIIAQAQSGSGKTVAFTCGMLSRIDLADRSGVQAICLSPTRELSDQIYRDALIPLSTYMEGLVVEKALAGMRVAKGAKSNAHLIVGSPGRILDLYKQGYFNFNSVKIFVLDEADAMVARTPKARSLASQTLEIKAAIPDSAQILFFSATFTPDILTFSKTIVPRAYTITLKNTESLVLKVIRQIAITTTNVPGGKLKVLQDIYTNLSIQQSIVFCQMKEEVNTVSRMMTETGFPVSILHGDLENEERDRVMDDFRHGRSKVLITTNALARGVDIPTVAVVVNYDLPVLQNKTKKEPDFATYVHRIGRTGRFGRQGTAINFLHTPEDALIMKQIEEFYCPGGGKMLTDWDPNDIESLAEDHNSRSSGI